MSEDSSSEITQVPRLRKKKDHTIPIIVVAIVIFVASILVPWAFLQYSLSLIPPDTTTMQKTPIENGMKYTFIRLSVAPEGGVQWSEIRIQLFDGVNYSGWDPTTVALSREPRGQVTEDVGEHPLGSINVSCQVTDLAGNGLVDKRDYFTLTTGSSSPFEPSVLYYVDLYFGSDGGQYHLYNNTFSG
jgi:hypothetical protein